MSVFEFFSDFCYQKLEYIETIGVLLQFGLKFIFMEKLFVLIGYLLLECTAVAKQIQPRILCNGIGVLPHLQMGVAIMGFV